MFLVEVSDILSLLFLSLDILRSFFLPDLGLDLVSSFLFFLSKSLLFDLLEEIVLGRDSLLMESLLSSLFIFEFGLFSGEILGKDPLVFIFLLGFVVFDDSLSHHVHELSLSLFTVSHLISSLPFLLLNESGVLLLGFDVLKSLPLLLFSLLKLVPFIVFKHLSEPQAFFLLSMESLLLLLNKFLLNLTDHSLVKILLLLEFESLPLVLVTQLLIS